MLAYLGSRIIRPPRRKARLKQIREPAWKRRRYAPDFEASRRDRLIQRFFALLDDCRLILDVDGWMLGLDLARIPRYADDLAAI